MSPSAITVENLTKTFPAPRVLMAPLQRKRSGRVEALRGVTLEVSEGEILGLLGPNGGGKTTLLEILATYLLPTDGRVRVHGHDLLREPLAVRCAVGYCPAGGKGLYPRLSGRQNLEFFALLNRVPAARVRERVRRLWELVGLDGFGDGPVARYSDGMRQRLALARALMTEPPVLLLDEPTRSLDPETALRLRRFLRSRVVEELGMTILLVTHDVLEAETICDRVAIVAQGQIVASGRPAEVLGTATRNSVLSPQPSVLSPHYG